jgi:acyl-coenzyme A thioesterase PaaI-like protein
VTTPPVGPQHHAWCFGCGPDNPLGLHLPWDAVEGETYGVAVRFDQRHQGAPGIVHGGIVSAALDEAMGILAQHVAFPSVTARFLVRYRRPVPTGQELRLTARLARTTGKQRHFTGAVQRGEQVLADGEGWFVEVPLGHFLQTEAGREVRDRLHGGDGS